VNGQSEQVRERRSCPRRGLDVEVFAAISPEMALPGARAIDVCRGGMLMAFAEPVRLLLEWRMLVSMRIADFRFHAIASVVRCERGADLRTYVAMKFVDVYETDYDELCERLDRVEQMCGDASA
jgi:hypothetical protein